MVAACKTWSIAGDKRITGLCGMDMLMETERVMRGGCPACATPIEGIGNCANCITPPPATYNVTISVVPTRAVTYYPWLPAYAGLGLVEDPPGYTAALVNDGQHVNPGNCGYSRSYNLFETSNCRYESEELEVVVSSLGLAPGGFNTSPVYDIQCRNGTVANPNYTRRKRVVLTIESVGSQIQYRVLFRYVVERRDPIFVLNPVFLYESGRAAVAPDRDCWKPFRSTLTGPSPFVSTGDQLAVLWSMSILAGAH